MRKAPVDPPDANQSQQEENTDGELLSSNKDSNFLEGCTFLPSLVGEKLVSNTGASMMPEQDRLSFTDFCETEIEECTDSQSQFVDDMILTREQYVSADFCETKIDEITDDSLLFGGMIPTQEQQFSTEFSEAEIEEITDDSLFDTKPTQEQHVSTDLCEAEIEQITDYPLFVGYDLSLREERTLATTFLGYEAPAASINTPVRKNTLITAPASSQDNGEGYPREYPHNTRQPIQQNKKRSVFSQKWTAAIEALTFPIKHVLLVLTHYAASRPYTVVVGIIIFSVSILLIGWQTNFYVESREDELWRPLGSMAATDGQWIDSTINDWGVDYLEDARRLNSRPSFLQSSERIRTEVHYRQRRLVGGGSKEDYIALLIHKNGENVVSIEGCDRLFEAHDAAITTPGFADVCAVYGDFRQCPKGFEFVCQMYDIPSGENAPYTCERVGPTAFFLNSSDNYKSRAKTDRDVQEAMSFNVFPGEYDEFNLKHIIGHPDIGEDGILSSGESFSTIFTMPNYGEGPDLSLRVIHRLLDLREEWSKDPDNAYSLEVFGTMSFSEEFERGIVKDIPLAFLAFVLMSFFTMFAFSKFDGCSFDWVHSRSTLGFGALCCILLSTMTGYGLLFCIGVPFTSLTQLLVFIMFGIGLDDAFIIMTTYNRTDPVKDVVQRVRDTIEEIGLSIFMTTATSVLAFGLGCLSTTPAIRWLCLYAFPTIAIDFVYQVTFFIGLLAIDETRVKGRRRDWLCCSVVPETRGLDQGSAEIPGETTKQRKHFAECIMIGYAKLLLKPRVKVLVLVLFSALFATCLYSASLMKVAFDFTDVLPSDSYIIDFNDAFNKFAENPAIIPIVFFRFVDQSDPAIQAQMENYVNDLVEQVDGITEEPLHFWLDQYKAYVEENINELFWLSFNETLHMFLALEENQRYRDDLILDSAGGIKVSRTRINLDNLDLTDVDDYLGSFRAIRRVGKGQPVNQDGDWAFFTFAKIFYLWEFLNNTEGELLNTTIYCISAVSAMALVMMPHWSAVLFIAPMVTILFIDLMGFLQFFGITINGISYIALVMSIGLLVDFLMHVALRFYETEKNGKGEKSREVLRTMGAAILLGGFSTFLGTLALAFASTAIFHTIFITFCGVVTLGLVHGLVLFPVVLSMIGPQ